MNKKLSIIIANYNTYKLTKECLESVYKFKPKFSFEVIVVDDASPDGSGRKLKDLEKTYKNLRVVLSIKNSGYVRSNNRGLNKSHGEYKLLLNSDTKVHRDAIDNLVAFAETVNDAGVVGSKLLNKDKTLQKSCYHFPSIKNALLEYFFGKKGLFDKYAPLGENPVVVDAVVGASFLITPKAYKQIGGLNPQYVSYFEDIDYCREVYRKGLKVYYLPTSVVTHYHGASFSQLSDSMNQWRRLIPSSIIYHGRFKHYILYIISLLGQKWQKIWQ